MATVTQRIKHIKQPRGGYLPVRNAKVTEFGGEILDKIGEENIHPSLIGTVVEYLTSYYVGDYPAEQIFKNSIKGAHNLGYHKGGYDRIMEKVYNIIEEIEKGKMLSDEVIKDACYLSSLEVLYKAGPQYFNDGSKWEPDEYTIKVIKELVERSITFLQSEGGIEEIGFELIRTSHGIYIDKGEGDYITKNGLWDLKVSKNKPDSKQTLQILVYYIMGLRSENISDELINDIKEIGIYNPRLNKKFSYTIDNLDSDMINEVKENVIGY